MRTALYILAIIGAWQVLWYVVLPLIDAVLFSMGRFIFNLIDQNWNRARQYKMLFIRYVLHSLWMSFYTRMFGRYSVEGVTGSKWAWKPYFHYIRLKG